jgi:hypothetical protein
MRRLLTLFHTGKIMATTKTTTTTKATTKATTTKAQKAAAKTASVAAVAVSGITLEQIAALSDVAKRFMARGIEYHKAQGSIGAKDGRITAIGKLANRAIKDKEAILKSLHTGSDTPQGGKMVKVTGGKFPYHLQDAYLVSGRSDSQAIFSLLLS